MGSSFGQLFRISTFGESHGGGVGVIVDGCPPRLPIDREAIQAELDRLDAAGIALIHRHPKPGADGKIIAFLHPKATGGSLIELCQDL